VGRGLDCVVRALQGGVGWLGVWPRARAERRRAPRVKAAMRRDFRASGGIGISGEVVLDGEGFVTRWLRGSDT
jgi:hypothetical protein